MTSMRTGQHSLVMKSFIISDVHGLVYAHALLYILSLPMPLDKFSHDEVIIFGHQRWMDQMFQLFFQHSFIDSFGVKS